MPGGTAGGGSRGEPGDDKSKKDRRVTQKGGKAAEREGSEQTEGTKRNGRGGAAPEKHFPGGGTTKREGVGRRSKQGAERGAQEQGEKGGDG